MPRLAVYVDSIKENIHTDTCKDCFPPSLKVIQQSIFSQIRKQIALAYIEKQIEDESGCDHPPYDETNYCCAACGRKLHEEDD